MAKLLRATLPLHCIETPCMTPCLPDWYNTFSVGAGTWLLLDGEEIAYERIYAEVHKGLCSVIVAP